MESPRLTAISSSTPEESMVNRLSLDDRLAALRDLRGRRSMSKQQAELKKHLDDVNPLKDD